ncbi:lectin-like protein [Eubacterium limosum]
METIWKRYLIRFCVAFIVLISFIICINDNKVYATTKSQDEAITWANSQVGKTIGSGECVAFIQSYYEYLGAGRSNGNARDYVWNTLPNGWTRIQGAAPQSGDVLVYTGGAEGYGHVAIYETDQITYHQNFNKRSVQKITNLPYNKISPLNYWGVIRPNFAKSDTEKPTIGNVWIDPHNHTEVMFHIDAWDSSGIDRIEFFSKMGGREEWHQENAAYSGQGNEWKCYVGPKDGWGIYNVHIYVYDKAGNSSFYAYNVGLDGEPPQMENWRIANVTDEGFDIIGDAWDEHCAVDRVSIAVWSEKNGQDDIRWEAPEQNGNTYRYHVNYSDHNSEKGLYYIHPYVYDSANNGNVKGLTVNPEYTPVKTITKNGHIYSLYDYSGDWSVAKEKCAEMGGHLVTINEDWEQETVEKLMSIGDKDFYWTGGYTQDHEKWRWVTNESFVYSKWAEGEPNNHDNKENYIGVYKNSKKWNDFAGDNSVYNGFILEIEPDLDDAVFTEMLNSHTYTVYTERLSWNEAKEKCEKRGGHLVTVNTPEEQQLVEKITSNYGSNYWLGGKLDETNVWRWVTGEVIQPQYWAPEQPDHGQGEPYLGTCTDKGLWNDYGNVSDNIDGYILELENTNADTPKSIIHNGKEYIRYDVGLPWNEAQQYCESQGGHLAIIRDEATQQAIAELIQGGRDRYLLGASDAENEGDWKWLDGSSLTYTHWGNDEPNNYDGNEDYLIMDNNGNWNDVILSYSGMSTIQGFICEKNPVKKGDLNNDSRVDIMDARKAKRAAMKEVHLTGSELSAADLNGDGKVDIMEARKIKRAAMKEINLEGE